MKKLFPLFFPASLALVACSGTSTVHLNLNSNDTTSNQSALSPAPTPPSTDLTTVQHVNVTVTEISVHVTGEDTSKDTTTSDQGSGSQTGSQATQHPETDQCHGEDVKDTDGGWQVVSSKEQPVDLMSVRGSATTTLGDATLPTGRLDQIRLKLKVTSDAGVDGDARIAGAVVDSDGTTCDLIVPHSVVNPGLKISGAFQASRLTNGSAYNVLVNIPLKNSTRDTTSATTCAFRLSPVVEFERVDVEATHSH